MPETSILAYPLFIFSISVYIRTFNAAKPHCYIGLAAFFLSFPFPLPMICTRFSKKLPNYLHVNNFFFTRI